MNGKGYGMPSSHAQFVSYFALSLTLFLLLRHRPPPPTSPSHTPLTLPFKLFLSTSAFITAFFVAASRIYLNYHTPTQVAAGAVAGGVSAVGWFGVTEWARREGWVEWGLETRGARYGRWRDLIIEEDLLECGWKVWEERRRERRRQVDGIGGKKER